MSSPTRFRQVAAIRGGRAVRGRHRVVWPSVAAERAGDDDAGAREASPGNGEETPAAGGRENGAPFGLPVLGELPVLAGVLDDLVEGDRRLLSAVAGLADLLASDGEVERTTGVGVDHWLAVVAVQTRMDRRLLVRACRLLHRLPALDTAVRRGRISFAQLRGLTIALRNCPKALDGRVDQLLTALLDGLERFDTPDPDVLVGQLRDALDELDPDDLTARERGTVADRYLSLQPRLDGTGGRFSGDLDAIGFALLDAVTTPPDTLLEAPGGYGAARADTLLARLTGPEAGHPADCRCGSEGPDGEPGVDRTNRASRDEPVAPAHTDGVNGDEDGIPGWWERLAPPKLLLRLPFDALLDDTVPAELLTTLVGGRLRLTSTAAKKLLDTRGAQLRTLVIDDDGAVLGIGRASRQPPGWLADAVASLHDTCTGPGCDRPAGGAQLDHAAPWWPVRPDDPAGTTDLDNLGPLCAATNRAKEAAGWTTVQTGVGTRTWHHPRSGLTTTTIPSTWRPDGDPRRRRRRSARPDDPGPPDGAGPPRNDDGPLQIAGPPDPDPPQAPQQPPPEAATEPGNDVPF